MKAEDKGALGLVVGWTHGAGKGATATGGSVWDRRRGAELYRQGGGGGSVVRRAEREPREGGLADCGSAEWCARGECEC